jgi:hypothetical protein
MPRRKMKRPVRPTQLARGTRRPYVETPKEVSRAIEELGQNIEIARLRRKILVDDLVKQAGIGEDVVRGVLKGDPRTNLWELAITLNALGIVQCLASLADPNSDPKLGPPKQDELIPKRARRPKGASKPKLRPGVILWPRRRKRNLS